MHFSTLKAIFSGIWAIDHQYAINRLPSLASMLAGRADIYRDNEQGELTIDRERGIAVIPVKGEIVKQDECIVGTETIGQWLAQADAAPNIRRIILDIDSPGGTVDGTIELAEKIRNTQTEVIAWINGMAASAAYWIASQADRIYARNEFSQVGSIGVMISIADLRPMMEKDGIRFHDIVSDLSPDKNQTFFQLLEGKYDTIKTEVLNPLAERFQKDVRQGRPYIKQEQMTGKLYFARDVLGTMVDGIVSDIEMLYPEDAIAFLDILSEEKTYYNTTQKATMMAADERVHLDEKQKKTFLQTFAEFLGLGKAESEEETAQTASETQKTAEKGASELAELLSKIEELEKKNSEIAEALIAKNEELQAAIEKLTEAEKRISELETEIEALQKLPGDTEKDVAPATDAAAGNTELSPVVDSSLPLAERVKRLSEIWNPKTE